MTRNCVCEGCSFHLRARNTKTSTTIRTNPQIHIQPLFQPDIPMPYPFTKPPHGAAGENGTLSGSFRPIVRYPSIRLAAAAIAGFRRRSRLAQVLCRIVIELLFAFGAAEVICLPSVLGVSSGISCLYLHAANGIFYRSDAAHRNLLGSRLRFDCVSILPVPTFAICAFPCRTFLSVFPSFDPASSSSLLQRPCR